MDAVLLAGGFGTRLRPLTYTRPKPLLPVAGRPMLEWVLDHLPPQVDHLIVAVNWRADKLEAHLAKRPGRIRVTVVRETEPLGTAGAVRNCLPHLRSKRLLVLNADIVSDMDLGALVAAHERLGGWGVISLKEVAAADVVHYGVIRPESVAGEPVGTGGVRIRDFVEKPKRPQDAPSRLINAGAYCLDRAVLDFVPAGTLVSMEKEVFPLLLERGLYGLAFAGYWIDVGDPERLREASRRVDPNFSLGAGSVLDPQAVWVDSIGGERCKVGAGARVERCVLGDDVTIVAGSSLADCIVGDGQVVQGRHSGDRIGGPAPAGYPEKQVGNAIAKPG